MAPYVTGLSVLITSTHPRNICAQLLTALIHTALLLELFWKCRPEKHDWLRTAINQRWTIRHGTSTQSDHTSDSSHPRKSIPYADCEQKTTRTWLQFQSFLLLLMGRIPFAIAAEGAMDAEKSGEGVGSDDFANDLFSDLAPLLSLFGEQVAKQYMSHSMFWLESVIFGFAPLGILTAITGAIRVSGPAWLKALIGRAREGKGIVELELTSSTSRDVAELWNGNGVSRVLGNADTTPVLEIIHVENKNLTKAQFVDCLKTEIVKAEKIYDFRSALKAGFFITEKTPVNSFPVDCQLIQDQAPPNIGINMARTVPSQIALWVVAIVGFILQGGVIAFAFTGVVGPLKDMPDFKKDDEIVPILSPILFTVGTFVLTTGMMLCGHIIEKSTNETYATINPKFLARNSEITNKVTKLWIQAGSLFEGEQKFESYYITKKPSGKWIWGAEWLRVLVKHYFWRLGTPDEKYLFLVQSRGTLRTGKTWQSLSSFAAIWSIGGYITQFIGIRKLSWTVAVAQLGATALMTGLRAYLRRGLGLGEVYGEQIASKHEIYVVARKIKKCEYWNVITPSRIFSPESIERMRESGELDGTIASSVILATCRLHELSMWKGPYHSAAETLVRAMKLTLEFLAIKGDFKLQEKPNTGTFTFRWHLLVEVQAEAEVNANSAWNVNNGEGKVQPNVTGTTPTPRRRFETIDFEVTREFNSDGSQWPISWDFCTNEKAAIEAIISHSILQNEFYTSDCQTNLIDRNERPAYGHGNLSVNFPALEPGQLETIQNASRFRYWDMSRPEFFRWVPKNGTPFERFREINAWHAHDIHYGLPIKVSSPSRHIEQREMDTSRFFQDLQREKTALDPMMICSQLIFSQFVACLPVEEVQKALGSDYHSNIPNIESNLQTGNTVRNPVLSDLALQLEEIGLGSYDDLLLSIVPPLKDCLPTQASSKIKDASGIREAIERISIMNGLELDLVQIEYADKLLLWCLNTADSSARLYAREEDVKIRERYQVREENPEKITHTYYKKRLEKWVEALGVYGLLCSAFDHLFSVLRPDFPLINAEDDVNFYIKEAESATCLFCEELLVTILIPMSKLFPIASNSESADSDVIDLFEKTVLEEAFAEERLDYRVTSPLANPGNRLWTRRKEIWKDAVTTRFRMETAFSQPPNVPLANASVTPLDLERITKGICSQFTMEFRKPIPSLFDNPEILNKAIHRGFALTVSFLLRDGAELNSMDALGRTPIHHAVIQGSPTVLRILLSEGLRRSSPQALNARDSRKQTALDIAIANNDGATARILLNYGAQEFESRTQARRMMQLSFLLAPELLDADRVLTVSANKRRIVSEFRLQSQDEYRMNTLHWVLWKGDSLSEFKRILQDMYEDVPPTAEEHLRQEDFVERTPIECAFLARRSRILKYLLESPFGIPAFGNLDVWYRVTYYATGRQDIELTRQILFEYSNQFDTETRLHVTTAIFVHALVLGSDHIIKMFCDVLKDKEYFERYTVSADLRSDLLRILDVETDTVCNSSAWSVNISNDGNSHLSSDESNHDISNSTGGRLDAAPDLGHFHKNLSQKTPLAFAAKMGRIEMVYSFLALGCRVDRKQEDFGRTALMLAVMEGNREVVSELLDAGADADVCDDDSRTALSYAAEQGDVQILELLLRRPEQTQISLKDKWHRTPLIYAAMYGHYDVFDKLLELDPNTKDTINIRDDVGRNVLSYAAESGQLALLQRLKGMNFGISSSDENTTQISDHGGRTPLSYAAEKGHLAIVELLLSIFPATYFSSDLRSPEGTPKPKFKTPLAYAAEAGHHDVVRRLIEHNADVHTIDESGNTPLHLAAKNFHQDVISILLTHDVSTVLATNANGKTASEVMEDTMHEGQLGNEDLSRKTDAYPHLRQGFASAEKNARARARWQQTLQQRLVHPSTGFPRLQQQGPLQTQETNPSSESSGLNPNGAPKPPPEPTTPPPPPPISRQPTYYGNLPQAPLAPNPSQLHYPYEFPPHGEYPPALQPSFPPPLRFNTHKNRSQGAYPPSLQPQSSIPSGLGPLQDSRPSPQASSNQRGPPAQTTQMSPGDQQQHWQEQQRQMLEAQ